MSPPNRQSKSSLPKRAVLGAAVLLFCTWLFLNLGRLTATPDGLIRVVLGGFFGLRLLLRLQTDRKSEAEPAPHHLLVALAGTALVLLGIIFRVHQFEWIGIVGLLYACLRWTLPSGKRADIARAMFLLYWIHPLPHQVLGPMHLALQKISVTGSEWMLHAFNIRAWADDLVLRTAGRSFEVPQACSGMRTATTVLLCVLGTGFALRFTLVELFVFSIMGLAQGVILNMVRISVMAAVAAGKSSGWSTGFLHDSTTVILLTAVLLVQVEAGLWERWLRKRWLKYKDRRCADEPWLATWSNVAHKLLAVISICLVSAGILALCYKRRPSHRATMISDVAGGMMRASHLEAADEATMEVVRLAPDDGFYRLQRARILLLRRKADDVLRELAHGKPGRSDDSFVTLEAWALAMTGRTEEAVRLLESLPASRQQRPLVAMAAAEIAVARDDPDSAARNVRWAARLPVLRNAVRDTYPFLAEHGKWSTISEVEDLTPHQNAVLLHTAVTAHFKTGKRDMAGSLLKANRALWSDNPHFLRVLLLLAVSSVEQQYWTTVFCDTLRGALPGLSVDDLYEYTEASFRLYRPDTAWLVYNRLRTVAPDHPGVLLIPARFADRWFTFRGPQFRIAESGSTEPVNMLPVLQLLSGVPGPGNLVRYVPLLERFAGESTADVARTFTEESLAIIAASPVDGLDNAGYSEWLARSDALELSGNMEAALDVLERTQALFPDRAPEIIARQTRLCLVGRNYERAYESARRMRAIPEHSMPAVDLIMINTLMSLDLGFYALAVSERAHRRFPENAAIAMTTAAVLDRLGHSEEALHFLLSHSEGRPSRLLIGLLEQTGRYGQAARLRDIIGLPPGKRAKLAGGWLLPPAEQAVTWTPPERRPPAETLKPGLSPQDAPDNTHTSPFLRELSGITARFHLSAPSADAIASWRAAGRDDIERAVALHRLSMLEAKLGDREAAVAAMREAVGFLPDCRFLWRILVLLSEGSPAIVQRAADRFPDDPALWLARLVTMVRNHDPFEEITRWTSDAVEGNKYSQGTFVRAGEFLHRSGHTEAAALAARNAWREDREYLPACALGVQCALSSEDTDWALKCAVQGARISAIPSPFLKTAVRLKMDAGTYDSTLDQYLKVLIEANPDEREWIERLGYVQFQQGETALALHTFEPLIRTPENVKRPGLLILIAEVLRLEHRQQDAVAILKTAHRLFPSNVHILNNLVYTLAQRDETLAEAGSMVGPLLEKGSSPAIFDTAAVTFFRMRDFERAGRYMDKAVSLIGPDFPEWRNMHLDAAQLHLDMGNHNRARAMLKRGGQSGPTWKDERIVRMGAAIEKAIAMEEARRGRKQ